MLSEKLLLEAYNPTLTMTIQNNSLSLNEYQIYPDEYLLKAYVLSQTIDLFLCTLRKVPRLYE